MAQAKQREITYAFGAVFRAIHKRETFSSPPAPHLEGRLYEATVKAAIAKCIEFNVVVNRSRRYDNEAFAFVSTLRGLVEDLIRLSYAHRFTTEERTEWINLLIALNIAEGIETQQAFFAANNPLQPVYGGGGPTEAARNQKRSLQARDDLKAFWKARGQNRKDGPTVRDMAADLGLTSIYDYLYFASSNFAHFNPQALLRTGWGPPNGPFEFSIAHFGGYYKSLCSFYGAVLFIGFHSAFSPAYFTTSCDDDIDKILELIAQTHRWPEIITFEEMNKPAPLYFLLHATREVMKGEKDAPPYGGVLDEVRGLRSRVAPP